MDFICNSLTLLYQFWAFWWVFVIGKRSMDLQEGVWTTIKPWINLQKGFQFWVSCQKNSSLIMVFAQLLSSKALGLCLGLCNEWIRLRILIKISFIHGFWDLIFHHYFFNLSMCFLIQINSNLSKSFPIWICTKSWE